VGKTGIIDSRFPDEPARGRIHGLGMRSLGSVIAEVRRPAIASAPDRNRSAHEYGRLKGPIDAPGGRIDGVHFPHAGAEEEPPSRAQNACAGIGTSSDTGLAGAFNVIKATAKTASNDKAKINRRRVGKDQLSPTWRTPRPINASRGLGHLCFLAALALLTELLTHKGLNRLRSCSCSDMVAADAQMPVSNLDPDPPGRRLCRTCSRSLTLAWTHSWNRGFSRWAKTEPHLYRLEERLPAGNIVGGCQTYIPARPSNSYHLRFPSEGDRRGSVCPQPSRHPTEQRRKNDDSRLPIDMLCVCGLQRMQG
jgi:hypothetical protein